MGLVRKKGNIVLDDLHYQASKYLYHMLEREGDLELRVVRSRKDDFWRTEPRDMVAAIDDNTLLVSMALVSNINGFLHDAKATSDAAHARGCRIHAELSSTRLSAVSAPRYPRSASCGVAAIDPRSYIAAAADRRLVRNTCHAYSTS